MQLCTALCAPVHCMDAGGPGCLRFAPMSELTRELWRDVSAAEFEAFLRDYPRPLEAHPPLSHKGARFREWLDATLGAWPDNAVAKTWSRGRCTGYQVRDLD